MAFGIFYTMAFLPVGLIAGMTIGLTFAVGWRMRCLLILATGVGFGALVLGGCAAVGANPFVIGMWNLHHHARFYDEYPRTYHLWLVANPIELVVAIGLPSAVWCLLGLSNPRRVPISFWAALSVLALVNWTGRNMGEVCAVVDALHAAASGRRGFGSRAARTGPRLLAPGGSIVLLGLQTLGLQTIIQVVYPV